MALLLLAGLANQASGSEPPTRNELALAMSAKVVCSAVFISGRDAEDALNQSAARFWGNSITPDRISMQVDQTRKRVTLRLDSGEERSAQFHGDQGCVVCREGREGIEFEPVPVKAKLPDAAAQPWPMGDLPPDEPLPPGVDKQRIDAAVERAFADADDLTAAFLVVYKNRIIAERYAPGITADTQLESWSMGKSITAALIGVLVQQGHLRLDDPAPIMEWAAPDDPRREIRIRDLMRMSSGLRFSATEDPSEKWGQAQPDHLYVYSGGIDAFDFSIQQPLEFAPNTVGRYRNCDPLVLGAIIKRTVTARGENYLAWPQTALFDRIGIRRQVLETDPYGNFLLTGHDYGTARNWARLGMLFLDDGTFNGQRVLPRGWTEFCGTPAPAWKSGEYGGLFWLNRGRGWDLPADALIMNGGSVSYTVVIPSRQVVLVRMGHLMGDGKHEATLNAVFKEILAAIDTT